MSQLSVVQGRDLSSFQWQQCHAACPIVTIWLCVTSAVVMQCFLPLSITVWTWHQYIYTCPIKVWISKIIPHILFAMLVCRTDSWVLPVAAVLVEPWLKGAGCMSEGRWLLYVACSCRAHVYPFIWPFMQRFSVASTMYAAVAILVVWCVCVCFAKGFRLTVEIRSRQWCHVSCTHAHLCCSIVSARHDLWCPHSCTQTGTHE